MPESKPHGFDPLNLIQIMLAQENMVIYKAADAYTIYLYKR